MHCLNGEKETWRGVHSSSFQFLDTSPFLQESIEKKHYPIPKSKQRLPKLRFLQKLGCQKPYWDQARLSSLVNKQDVRN